MPINTNTASNIEQRLEETLLRLSELEHTHRGDKERVTDFRVMQLSLLPNHIPGNEERIVNMLIQVLQECMGLLLAVKPGPVQKKFISWLHHPEHSDEIKQLIRGYHQANNALNKALIKNERILHYIEAIFGTEDKVDKGLIHEEPKALKIFLSKNLDVIQVFLAHIETIHKIAQQFFTAEQQFIDQEIDNAKKKQTKKEYPSTKSGDKTEQPTTECKNHIQRPLLELDRRKHHEKIRQKTKKGVFSFRNQDNVSDKDAQKPRSFFKKISLKPLSRLRRKVRRLSTKPHKII